MRGGPAAIQGDAAGFFSSGRGRHPHCAHACLLSGERAAMPHISPWVAAIDAEGVVELTAELRKSCTATRALRISASAARISRRTDVERSLAGTRRAVEQSRRLLHQDRNGRSRPKERPPQPVCPVLTLENVDAAPFDLDGHGSSRAKTESDLRCRAGDRLRHRRIAGLMQVHQ